MATHKAIIRAWIELEFEDDGISDLHSQVSDAFDESRIDPKDCDYQVLEIVEIVK